MTPNPLMMLAGPLFLGAAVAWFGLILVRLINQARTGGNAGGRFEVERRAQLRSGSWTYRNFEPWVDELVASPGSKQDKLLEKISGNLIAAGVSLAWHPAEYLAAIRIEATLAAAGAALFAWILSGWFWALAAGMITFFMYRSFAIRSLRQRADHRRLTIKRRLGAGIDLMALMMEVGGNFQDSLATVAKNSEKHPLGEELRRVMKDIESGRPRRDALRTFAQRLADEDAADIVFSIVKGEELGTPLATILRTQADQMRQKRSQWAEKSSQEAQVSLVYPAMVIMVACLIIVAAPFVLSTFFAYRGGL